MADTNTTWKPDFSKENPYEGAPLEYLTLVGKTYIPTVSIPISPVQSAALAGQVSSTFKPTSEQVSQQLQQAKITDKIPRAGDGYNLPQALISGSISETELRASGLFRSSDIDNAIKSANLAKSNPEDLFNQQFPDLVAQGYKFNKYDPSTGTFSYSKPITNVLPGNFVGPPAPGEVTWREYSKEAKIPEGSKFVSFDKDTGKVAFTLPPDKTISDKLKDFTLNDGSYNYSLALARKAVTPEELVKFGVSQDEVDKLQIYAQAREQTGVALPGEAVYLQRQYRDYKKAEDSFNEVMNKIDKANPKLSQADRAELYKQTPEYSSFIQISKALGDKGLQTEAAIASRFGVDTASMLLFAPARALKPEVQAKDISGLEWTIGGAQLATMGLAAGGTSAIASLSPLLSKVADVAAVGTMAGTSIYSTGKQVQESLATGEWNPFQLGLSLAIDYVLSKATLGALKSPLAQSTIEPTNVEKARQYINTLAEKHTPEGISAESPLVNVQGGSTRGFIPEVSSTAIQSQQKAIAILENSLARAKNIANKAEMEAARLNIAKGEPERTAAQAARLEKQAVAAEKTLINSRDTVKNLTDQLTQAKLELNSLQGGELASRQANITATYAEYGKDLTNFGTRYNDLQNAQSELAFQNQFIDGLRKSLAIPDNVLESALLRQQELEKLVQKLRLETSELEKVANKSEGLFRDSFKGYTDYLKDNNIYPGLGKTEFTYNMDESLPRNSTGLIKDTIDNIYSGGDLKEAIAVQEQKVEAARAAYEAAKSEAHGDTDALIQQVSKATNDYAEEQATLNRLKLSAAEQTRVELTNAREAKAEIDEIIMSDSEPGYKGKASSGLSSKTREELVKLQAQLDSRITELNKTLSQGLIEGKGSGTFLEYENITDANGNIIAKIEHGPAGTFRYDVDEYGNIIRASRREESTGGSTKTAQAPVKPEIGGGDTRIDTRIDTRTARESFSGVAPFTIPVIRGISGAPEEVTTEVPQISSREVPEIGKQSEVSSTPGIETSNFPRVESAPDISSQGETVSSPETGAASQVVSISQTGTRAGTGTEVTPGAQEGTSTQIQPETQLQEQTATQVATQTETSTETETETATETPIIVPPTFKAHKKKTGEPREFTEEDMKEAVVLRHGLVWLLEMPPHRGEEDLYILDAPPPSSIPRIDVGKPRETVSALGGGQVPQVTFTIPRGMYNITYTNGQLEWHYNDKYHKGRSKAAKARAYQTEHIQENIDMTPRQFENFGTPNISIEKLNVAPQAQPLIKGVVQ